MAAIVVTTGACWLERVPEQEEETETPNVWARIDAVMDSSARAWNAGDLDGFMAPYREVETTTYIGSGGLRIGFSAVRERFEPLFAPGAERDSLRFEDLRVRPLAQDLALVVGRYVLHRVDTVTDTGIFSLVFERTAAGWRIVHDHSSALPLPPGDTAS